MAKRVARKQGFEAQNDSSKPKYYALDMFPYPSGKGLHVGHLASYTPTDVISRFKRNKGFNVLHPMGYDAFGLPAEQYAIQTGIHPEKTTKAAIESFRKTLIEFGYSFDWSREVSTCDPSFYKWTQFIFKKLYEKGLAYQKEVPVNWCPALKTVLANEEVVDGKSERGGHPVVRKPMKQWMLKITDYADRLLRDLEKIEWPERTKEGQKNWIGRSEGAEVDFKIKDHDEKFRVFTTRPDTLFGVTFMVISPEHPLTKVITTSENKAKVEDYIQQASSRSEVDRKSDTTKTGVFTGAHCLHPLTGEEIPIWTADYVLMDYGTGAIMAVPGHDERDFEFAEKFGIEIKRVLESKEDLPFIGDGKLVNSQFLDGLDKSQAITAMIEHLEKESLGEKKITYKLRDWLFSRQRYWGEPFPVVHYPSGDLKLVPDNELPVLLPEVDNYEPSEDGRAPLSNAKDWLSYDGGERETDTMPGSAGSSWYFLRYCDPHNTEEFASKESQNYWMPVDLYIGGPEHTVGHLLYSRFWQKVLFDAGLVTTDEPFNKLAHQGMILGEDGEKMSKSRGNVVNPDDIKVENGADALRVYILFLGPMDRDKPWNPKGIDGVKRFLDRYWRACVDDSGNYIGDDSEVSMELNKTLHKTIKKVEEDIESLSFNTAISAMMILLNEVYKSENRPTSVLKALTVLLSPFAPHITEEVWHKMGEETFVAQAPWPQFDPQLTIDDTVTIGVQINGKVRGSIELAKDATEEEALKAARSVENVESHIGGKELAKVIYKAGRILNLIVKK